MVGPPGRGISLHNRKNTWVGTGAFQVTLGPKATAQIGDFSTGTLPSFIPKDSSVSAITPLPPGQSSFNDVVSSYKFIF